MSFKKMISILTLAAFVVSTSTAMAADRQLPASFQAVLFKKVCTQFFTELDGNKISIITHQDDLFSKELAKQLRHIALDVEVLDESQFENARGSVIYLANGLSSDTLKMATQTKKLVFSGTSGHVREGIASLGFVMDHGKPSLVTNVSRLEQSESKVALSFFRYAKVQDSQLN